MEVIATGNKIKQGKDKSGKSISIFQSEGEIANDKFGFIIGKFVSRIYDDMPG